MKNKLFPIPFKGYSGKRGRLIFLLMFFCCIIFSCKQDTNKQSSSILVFAAASLRDVMQEIAVVYEQQYGVNVIYNFAGSNVLARQIAAAPKADVFLSANTQWMDYLEEKNLLEIGGRRQFLSNSLIFIAHQDTKFEIKNPINILDLSFRYLSIGDPKAVPAGRYAKEYLDSISSNKGSLWSQISNKILPAPNARAAIAAVESIPDVIGLVYKTDALASSKVRVLYNPDIEDIPKIIYVGASIRKTKSGSGNQQLGITNLPQSKGKKFMNFLSQANVASIFVKHGFINVGKNPELALKEALH